MIVKHTQTSFYKPIKRNFWTSALFLIFITLPMHATNWEWDRGGGNSYWSNFPFPYFYNNWNPNNAPTTVGGYTPNITFGTLPGFDQTIYLADSFFYGTGDKTVHNIYFTGQYDYTLRPYNNERLIFDDGVAGGGSLIQTSTGGGSGATHTLDLSVIAHNDLTLDHQVNGKTFYLSGNDVDINSHKFIIDNVGDVSMSYDTTLSGSSSSELIKKGTGLMWISTNNSYSFHGSTTVEAGELKISHDHALGSSGPVEVKSGGTLSLKGSIDPNNTLTIAGTGSTGQGALYNKYDNNRWDGDIILSDDATIGVSSGTTLQIKGVLSGTDNLTKSGDGWLKLENENTLSGQLIIDDGLVKLNASNGKQALKNIDEVIVNSGGTLLWHKDHQVNDMADITLNGGILDLSGKDDVVGTLTLSATSTIDMDGGGHITFEDAIYNGGTFIVDDWDYGHDHIFFSTVVPQTFLDNVYWKDLDVTGAMQLSSGEIVPIAVPEPSTWITGITISILGFYRTARRQILF